ncbi:epididymal-specific lipocalin-8 isoform X3 [Eumetopias jubatus]|uniref:epididymal-specific lipocalin-8 isoform X3 n=1 Tax=Eumetopias jubatus TaxID=34886 RepID=UPI00101689AC|nr:epididymal-specific lipocalin-8 isoform X3 [Eumetopias jubatus]XP_027950358.1 epididymal-specific lipocalin-8 isoform X3 [Eumetopias jubatus]
MLAPWGNSALSSDPWTLSPFNPETTLWGPDPGSKSPSCEDLPGLLPHRRAPGRRDGHGAQVRYVLLWGQGGSLTPAETHLGPSQIVGFWREVGVASSQNLALKTPKRLEALFLTLSGHELIVKAAYNSSGSCETEKIVSSEIDVSGTFVFPGHREIHVIDTDYEQYAILRLSLHWQGKDYHVLKYFTRSLEDEYGPGFWKFREMTADMGLYLVARHGRCAKLLKEVSRALGCAEPPRLSLPT